MNGAPIALRPTAIPDPESLTVLSEDVVAGRHVGFGIHADLPRLWVAFSEVRPTVLGYVSGLVVDRPILWISEPEHEPWVSEHANASDLIEAAVRIWVACLRSCEG